MSGTRIFDIAILDRDKKTGEVLHDALKEFKKHPTVEGVAVRLTPHIDTINKAKAVFQRSSANALMVDIYAFGAREGIEFYQWLRDNYPLVPICRYATQADLDKQPGVLADWIDRGKDSWFERLRHVYSIPKYLNAEDMAKAVERELNHFRDWIDAHENKPILVFDATIPAIRLRSELVEQDTERLTVDNPKLIVSNVVEHAHQKTELQDKPYVVAMNGLFNQVDTSTVAELRTKAREFEVFVDDEMAELFIDGKPIVYPGPQVIGLLRLLLEKGTGEILDKDVAKVLGYEVAKDKPIRQLYRDLKKAIKPKLEGNVVARRGLHKRVFKQTFTFCFIKRS